MNSVEGLINNLEQKSTHVNFVMTKLLVIWWPNIMTGRIPLRLFQLCFMLFMILVKLRTMFILFIFKALNPPNNIQPSTTVPSPPLTSSWKLKCVIVMTTSTVNCGYGSFICFISLTRRRHIRVCMCSGFINNWGID